jgi:hypothetical protein
VQRVAELVIHDVGDAAGVLTLRALDEEVEIIAGRERIARLRFVDEHRQRLIEVREPGIEPRLRERLDLVGIDEARQLRILELVVRAAPDRGAAVAKRQRGGGERAGSVGDRDPRTGQPWHHARRRGSGPGHDAAGVGRDAVSVDAVDVERRGLGAPAGRGHRRAPRNIELHRAGGIHDLAGAGERDPGGGVDVHPPAPLVGGRLHRHLLGERVGDVDAAAARPDDRHDHAVGRDRPTRGGGVAVAVEPARGRRGHAVIGEPSPRQRDGDMRQRGRADQDHAVVLEREADRPAEHADAARALLEPDTSQLAARAQLVGDHREVCGRRPRREHVEVGREEPVRPRLGDPAVGRRARDRDARPPQPQRHVGVVIEHRCPAGEPGHAGSARARPSHVAKRSRRLMSRDERGLDAPGRRGAGGARSGQQT